jgi:hypothetical protein
MLYIDTSGLARFHAVVNKKREPKGSLLYKKRSAAAHRIAYFTVFNRYT